VAETRLDALTNTGRNALESDFELEGLKRWREQAHQCVAILVGEDHPYAEHFKRAIRRAEFSSLLTDVGVITGAKLRLLQGFESCDTTAAGDSQEADSDACVVRPTAPFCYLTMRRSPGGGIRHGCNAITNHFRGWRLQDKSSID